jgi:hypothetical protein
MGTVFRKQTTRALPAGTKTFAKRGRRFARWTAKDGKTRTAPVTVGQNGSERVVTESRTYFARYRDGAGIVRTVATGCRDEQAARNRLAELVRTAERVRAGISTTAEERTAGLRPTALAEHFADYLTALEAAGVTPAHRANVRRFLDRLASECGFDRLADLDRGPLVRWLAQRAGDGMGARTRNAYRETAVAFGRWTVRTGRLTANPFADVPKADVRSDPRRQRRSLTEVELRQLLDVAARRSLDDARMVRRGERRGQAAAELRPETIEGLQLRGRERALITNGASHRAARSCTRGAGCTGTRTGC